MGHLVRLDMSRPHNWPAAAIWRYALHGFAQVSVEMSSSTKTTPVDTNLLDDRGSQDPGGSYSIRDCGCSHLSTEPKSEYASSVWR